MELTLGFDFGTSNTAVSINRNNAVEVIDIDRHNSNGKTARSVIYFDEEKNIFIGQEAIDQYIENGAAGRFMQSIKSFLPIPSFDKTVINGKEYGLEDLIAIILGTIKKRVETHLGTEITRVVAGRPAVFSKDPSREQLAENRLLKSFARAGFKDVTFQFEPIAAALTFESTLEEGEERIVFVGDFGGGTSDFTVIRLCGGQRRLHRKNDILSVGGVYIGGDSFDSEIMWQKISTYFGKGVEYKAMGSEKPITMPLHLIKTLCQWHHIPQLKKRDTLEFIKQVLYSTENKLPIERLLSLIRDNFGFMLFQSIEKAKCELSAINNSQIIFKEGNLSIREEINRKEFEEIIYDKIFQVTQAIQETLLKSELPAEKIDSVFITGGSSHIPCIRKIFEMQFGKDKMQCQDAFTSVAYGLGVSASMTF